MPYASIEHRRICQVGADARKRQRAIDFVRQAKMVPCADCGIVYDHWIMEFDHIGDKLYNVSQIHLMGYKIKRIAAEIAKCDIVCANCHKDRTWKRRNMD